MKTINFFRSKLFALTLALMAGVASFAYDEMPPDFKVDGLYYNFLEGDNVEVTHPYRPALPTESASNAATQDSPDDYANLTELTIPSTVTYEGKVYNVIHIGYAAFDQCYNLTYVDIPSSIKTIGVAAFSNCSSLTSITLKEGLEHIEGNAFADCRLLETITFPNSLKTVGSYAFSFTAWYNNQPNGGVYAGNVFYKYKGDIPQNTSFVIKEGTVSISPDAFIKENRRIDYGLVDVAIPNSVEIIGEYAFSNCRALRSVNIPHEVTTIENYAFSYCKSLTSVTCEIVEPLSLPSDVFFSASVADATLYVPAESVEAYKNADQWKDFGQILPIEPTSYKSQWCDTWNMFVENGSVYPPHEETYRYQLAKDTVIGDYTYTAVVSKAINDALDAPHYVAAVRFTDDRKVYIYYDNAEYLLYDFNVQQGDELEVFAGINNYTSEIKTYKCTVTGVEQYACVGCPATITLEVHNHPDDFREFYRQTQWIEGVGDINGFLNGINGYINIPGNAAEYLLCAYQGDELKYTGDLYEEYGCGDDAEQNPEDLFPTLWGLQRTSCTKTIGEDEEGTVHGLRSTLMKVKQDMIIDGKQYVLFGEGHNYDSFLLREKGNKVFVYSSLLRKDLVLYDYTLEVGDSLPALYIDWQYHDAFHQSLPYNGEVVDYNKDYDGTILPADTFIVTNISTITLLDGKEHKKWTFNNGMQYVEGIGSYGTSYAENDFYQLIANVPQYSDADSTFLVCVSKNNKLLYQMDEAEMERLGAECLCEVETSYKSQWCDTWNVLQHSTGINYEPNLGEETWIYYLAQDTIINNHTYTSVYRYWSIKDLSTSAYYASVRFTEDKKVYVYYDDKEYLVYDFLAQVGDTLEVFGGYHYDVNNIMPCVVQEVKTDSITNRTLMKLYAINVHDGTICNGEFDAIEWIEGVGSTRGFLTEEHPCVVGGLKHWLLCAHKGDELKYTGSLYEKYGCEYNAEAQNNWSDTWCNQWNILSHGYQGPQDPLVAARTSIFWLSNNTVNRDGQEYIPLMCSSSKPDVESTNLIGELRFTEDKQVYFYYDNTEYLLYDFDVQVGDTLDIFGGIELYSYSFVEQKTYPHVITKIDTLDDGRLQITSDAILIFEDGEVGTFEEKQQQIWIEGLGSINGIVHTGINPGIGGNPAIVMLCAYRDDECVYKTDFNDPYWIDYTQLGCVYNAGDFIEGAFPMLSGLQRTICNEYCGETEDDNSANNTYKQTFDSIFFENDKPYILCNDYLLREEDNKILIYSQLLNKDLVLYDFTLEVGDSLPALYIDYQQHNAMDWMPYNPGVVDYNIDHGGTIYPADTFIVTNISTVTLLDGKEYKKWTFNNGMEYVEGIGMYGGHRNGDFFRLIQEIIVPCNPGTHLVCASRNGQLLYQMDEAEMERLGAECLCEVETSYKSQWCDTWNVMLFDGMRFDETASTSRYRLGKDTIIGDYTYSKFTSRTSVRFTSDRKVYVYYEGFDDNDPYTPDLPTGEYLAYDFSAQVGDTLEVFSGVGTYSTYSCIVYDVQTDSETNLRNIMLHPLCVVDEDGNVEVSGEEITWLEGVGSPEGFLISYLPCGWAGGGTFALLCAYKGDELKYTGSLYDEYGCEYNATEQNPADLFPTLWGLQRTTFYHYTECSDSYSSLTASNEIVTINDKPYLRFGKMFLREENNQVLIYSAAYDKDLVLYDWNLEVGDSISLLAMDYGVYPEYAVSVVDYRVIVDIDENGDLITDTIPTDKVVVDKISTITLLDGKEYKTWHLATGWAGGITYVEGIGILSEGYGGGDYLGLIRPEELPTCYYGDLLVCVSKNNKLLYQMDDEEMERLGAECLCDYDRGPRKDNAKDGQIGGRPTPTQWNQLELDLREMENGTTILRAETFSYTLEDISQQVNNKTYFQLARQSTKDTATTKSVVGALHFGKDEDNRVYFLRDGVEYVLYDFTAEIGDTVEIFAGINNYPQETTYTHVVTGKDTLENGACRMLLEVVFPDDTNATAENAEKVWLAGLGSVDGIVHNAAKRTSNAHAAPSRTAHSSDTQTSVMLCAWREDSCLYTTDHPDYNDIGCIYNQDPTAIEDTHSSSPMTDYQKLLRNGQLLIIHKGKTYNVLGVQIK